MTPELAHHPRAREALDTLLAGNARFVASRMRHPHQDPARREALRAGQRPLAAILGCSDSRITPEVIFDCGLGDLFVVRLAGNVPDDFARASLEYAVEHLDVPLLVVLGHSQCGAITAAAGGGSLGGHLDRLADALRPAVAEARREEARREGAGGDGVGSLVDLAARCGARSTAAELREAFGGEAPDGASRTDRPAAVCLAAYYDQTSGSVTILEP